MIFRDREVNNACFRDRLELGWVHICVTRQGECIRWQEDIHCVDAFLEDGDAIKCWCLEKKKHSD